jgi:putative phosphoribosyl transferase
MMMWRNRQEAGRALARRLAAYARRPDVIVLGLPRGGVPVAYEIAEALDLALDVFLVRKLGVPGNEELAMGAIASGGARVLDLRTARAFGVSDREIESVVEQERRELARREQSYRDDRPALEVRRRAVILVDDGLATGSSMLAAVTALRPLAPSRIVVAVPVAPRSTAHKFQSVVEEFVCLGTPEPFGAVGAFYEDFSQTTDAEVRELLARRAADLIGVRSGDR